MNAIVHISCGERERNTDFSMGKSIVKRLWHLACGGAIKISPSSLSLSSNPFLFSLPRMKKNPSALSHTRSTKFIMGTWVHRIEWHLYLWLSGSLKLCAAFHEITSDVRPFAITLVVTSRIHMAWPKNTKQNKTDYNSGNRNWIFCFRFKMHCVLDEIIGFFFSAKWEKNSGQMCERKR